MVDYTDIVAVKCPQCGSNERVSVNAGPPIDLKKVKCAACGKVFDAVDELRKIAIQKGKDAVSAVKAPKGGARK